MRKIAATLGVAALGLATTAAGLTFSTPAAHALDVSAASITLLGDNDNNEPTISNSEFRADFVVKTAAGVTISKVQYSYYPQSTAASAISNATSVMGEMSPVNYLKDTNQNYAIEQQVTVGGSTYYAISSHGDSEDVPGYAAGTYYRAVVVTLSDGSKLERSFEIKLTDPAVTPVMPTPWDSGWGGASALGTSQDNWGVNTGQAPSSSNTDGTAPLDGRFIVGTIDKTSTSAQCTDQSYQWFDANGTAVGSIGKTGKPAETASNTPKLGTTAVELTSVPAFTAPGYYKLIGWPCGTNAGKLSDGQQIGSVFHDLLPDTASVAPSITAPTDGTAITKKTGSPTTITGTLPARTDQRAYVAADKVTVSDQDGNKVCDATVVAAAGGKATTWSCDVTLKDGDYTLSAVYTQASDTPSGLKNITSATSNSVMVSVDRTAITPVINSPKDGTRTKESPTEISGDASDALNPPGTVTVMDGTTVLCKDVPIAADGSWTCVLTDELAVGVHTISVTYTDEVGNVSAASDITYEVLGPEPGPTVTVQGSAPATTTTATPDPETIVETLDPETVVETLDPETIYETVAPTSVATVTAGSVVVTSESPEPLAFTGASFTGPLALGGGLAALGGLAYVLARRARAHRKALSA